MSQLPPVLLRANQPARPYRGGEGISRFRNADAASDAFLPEDFVGSTTEVFTGGGIGLSLLADGTLLKDAIAHDPAGYLGQAHVDRFGASTELLVKLLDTAERLFVHFHPTVEFAEQHLSLGHGKTEAWIIVDARPTDGAAPHAHLGFTRDVSEAEVARWVDEQDVAGMLGAMHRVELAVGSTLLVPAGMPHSISAGVTLVELQEPTDLSVLMEFSGFGTLTADDAFLGLDPEIALSALDRSASDAGAVAALAATRADAASGSGVTRLFPASADAFFRAERIEVAAPVSLDAGFSILVVTDGRGTLSWAGGTLDIERGATLLVPHGAGDVTLEGALTALRCRPPAA